MAFKEAGVYLVVADLCDLAACDIVGVEPVDIRLALVALGVLDGRGLGHLEIDPAVPAVGHEVGHLRIAQSVAYGHELAVDDAAKGVGVAVGLVGVLGEGERVELPVIEAVRFDYIAVVYRIGHARFGIVAHERALLAAGRAAAEVDLALIGAYVVKVLSHHGTVQLRDGVVLRDPVQTVAHGIDRFVVFIQAVARAADLHHDAVVFKVRLVLGHVGVYPRIMTLTQRGLDDAGNDSGYLTAAGRARAVKALCRVHADHYAG